MRYIRSSSVTLENITKKSTIAAEFTSVAASYPFRVSPSYAKLIRREGDAIWKQCIPDLRELDDAGQCPDPLAEHLLSPVPGLIHRYPDRVVLLVSNRCPVYCRFCMRKRHVGEGDAPMDAQTLKQAMDYIAANPAIRDIILSGGDPLMLDDDSLHHILQQLRAIPHVTIIRIGTRVPVTLPERVTPELCTLLKRFHPLYINTHFNHPDEITPLSARACDLLADAGIPLGNQTVLLRGVNDSLDTMRSLQTGLLSLRVRPYYIHQMDLVRGTAHFRTPIATGLEIIRGLRGHVSGMAVPQYVIDLPDGKGKVPILPDDVERQGDLLILRTYQGEMVRYRDLTTVADS
ncbi:KamA family radical SAM protein [Pelobacter propionicus]|uniref:L-lysine 2,3-aminomutase n=1 Tax=Pelobacter propionicus (strain DSM 2379 / NBRC 103807 / OttBd1) TaxID=338966 RepID=A1APV7_PELPD|nr:L-lysine 2,3-aminomutase [Pelobacter propionicus DSM 2379]